MIAKKKIGLALSGGGYRAAAYHIGTLRALNRLGVLENVDVISSVSGGSITAAYYALNKDDYKTFEKNFSKCLSKGVLASSVWYLVAMCFLMFAISTALGHLIAAIMSRLLPTHFIASGVLATLIGLIFLGLLFAVFANYSFVTLPTSKFISKLYDKLFFKKKVLGDLPDTPLLSINSTNLATQLLFSFSKKDMGEYAYRVKGKSIFNGKNFPISKAVMASSCVPYGFTPITIDDKYLVGKYSDCAATLEPPKLIDGGVYDNQGAHKLSQKNSRFHTDYIIVSDAGNIVITASETKNIFSLVINTINMMLARLTKLQRSVNLYQTYQGKEHFAYVPLQWDCDVRLIQGFVNNLKDDNVHPDVWEAHSITEEDIISLKESKGEAAKNVIIEKVKSSMHWSELKERIPSEEVEKIARSVGTSLTALSAEQIDALIAHSDWLAEAQIRLYMPMLINQNDSNSLRGI